MHNVYFRPKKIVVTAIENESPVFCEIQKIIKDLNKQVFFIVQQVESEFNHHFHCYAIKSINPNIFCIPLTSLIDYHCMTTHRLSSKLVISTKYGFF